ncbi:MAG TPA: hypothetical protein VF681_14920 [Abditibacteriaceae bacterium]|jgi:hypothetical protein
MKRILLLACVLGVAQNACARPADKLFKGAWFDVRYPAGWTAKPGQKSETSDTGVDSARFVSPDNRAEFYVFSPMWNGTPQNIYNLKNEVVVARRVQTTPEDVKRGISGMRVIWTTVRAKDNAYLRSILDRESLSHNTRNVFAFRYRNDATRRKYAPAFERFKKSLRQYLD